MEKRLSNWFQNKLIDQKTYEVLLREVKEEAEHKRKVGLIIA